MTLGVDLQECPPLQRQAGPHNSQGRETTQDSNMNSKAVYYSNVKTDDGYCPTKRRYVQKDGSCNIMFRHVPDEWLLYVTDIFTTLVEIRWRVMFLTFALSYILSWLFFGILFWIIALIHGDIGDTNNEPCIYDVRSFTAAFLFSLETQTTIGYGSRGMSENCMLAIITVTIQDIISIFIDTFVIGIVVAKMASARKRAQTIGFSNIALLNRRNGHLCLSWRVGDFRRNHMVEGTTHALLIRHKLNTTGKADITYHDLEIQNSHVILATPVTIIHQINDSSPLFKMKLQELHKESFDLVVTFTYTDDCSGILHQSRSSYTPSEILWGQQFEEMVRVTQKSYRVDYAVFHRTVKVPLMKSSAEDYELSRHPPSHTKDQRKVCSLAVESEDILAQNHSSITIQQEKL
ncbi:Inward rectifier potassium channel 16 [Bagarius yarrelli]|uniref:Inward rectifier potassium channel 16 n=1 Tax=Bagarius yarrelli TaxID=175774 RepID=A0A556V853_BAGYA|nr:Inward rectifier potassium channel 16 [Bagarius yarrelli]